MAAQAEPALIDVTQFTCPRCGGCQFGTTSDMKALNDPNSGTGHCHGMLGTVQAPRTCGFTWPRSDDAKYFCKTGKQIAAMYVGTM
jgi:hypothetical protein